MLSRVRLSEFFVALYEDPRLKSRLIAATFLGLVLPAALLISAGVPDKPVYVTMSLLTLPLLFGVYGLSRQKRDGRNEANILMAGADRFVRRSRLSYVRYYLRILTLVLPFWAYCIAVKIRFGFNLYFFPRSAPAGPSSYWGIMLLTTIVWAIAAEESGLWSVEQLYAPGKKSRRLLEAVAFTYAIVMALGFLFRRASYSTLVIGLSAGALYLLATTARFALRVILELMRRYGRNEVKILMVGTDHFARHVATSLQNGEVLPCKVVGFVRLPNQDIAVEGPVYEIGRIPNFSSSHSIDDVVVALTADRLSDVQSIAPRLERLRAPKRVVFDLGRGVGIRDRWTGLGGIHTLDLRPTAAEVGPYLFERRVFDVAFSVLIVLLTLPISLLIMVAIKLSSPGPVLFVQKRVGLNGRLFRMLKFRTMRMGSQMGSQKESDTRWTSTEDPRRTAVGMFLRKTNLDELPQFINVIKGDMSIVGPRPERPHFVEKFLDEFDRYNLRKPGVTGWAQVNDWADTSKAKRMEQGLYYFSDWSLALDLRIITAALLRIFGRMVHVDNAGA